MEADLLKYRKKKLADERSVKMKKAINNAWNTVTSKISAAVLPESNSGDVEEDREEDAVELISQDDVLSSGGEEEEEEISSDIVDQSSRRMRVLMICLKFLMWLFTYIGFLKIGFGAVFFAISALYFIYANTGVRRNKRKKGEKSAYSVFNENCEPIHGTLKAEQLERQLLFGGVGGF